MFLLLGVSSISLASTYFHGAKVDLLLGKGNRQFSLHTVFHNRVEDLRFGDSVDYPEFGSFKKETTLRVEPIGWTGQSYLVACIPTTENSGGMAGIAYVFGITEGRVKEIGHIDSNQMFSFPTVAKQRRVLAKSFEIGQTMCHAAMPRWQEFFEVRNSKLVQVKHSKLLYRPWMASLWETMLHYPSDATCWHYYGVAVSGSQSKLRPKTAYRRMLAERKSWTLGGALEAAPAAEWLRSQERIDRWPSLSTNH